MCIGPPPRKRRPKVPTLRDRSPRKISGAAHGPRIVYTYPNGEAEPTVKVPFTTRLPAKAIWGQDNTTVHGIYGNRAGKVMSSMPKSELERFQFSQPASVLERRRFQQKTGESERMTVFGRRPSDLVASVKAIHELSSRLTSAHASKSDQAATSALVPAAAATDETNATWREMAERNAAEIARIERERFGERQYGMGKRDAVTEIMKKHVSEDAGSSRIAKEPRWSRQSKSEGIRSSAELHNHYHVVPGLTCQQHAQPATPQFDPATAFAAFLTASAAPSHAQAATSPQIQPDSNRRRSSVISLTRLASRFLERLGKVEKTTYDLGREWERGRDAERAREQARRASCERGRGRHMEREREAKREVERQRELEHLRRGESSGGCRRRVSYRAVAPERVVRVTGFGAERRGGSVCGRDERDDERCFDHVRY